MPFFQPRIADAAPLDTSHNPPMVHASLMMVLAQVGSSPWLEGGIFVLLAGAVLFAICRSSGRN